ncbi:hypothetical protein Tco_0885015 [Tanacetum coccineum]
MKNNDLAAYTQRFQELTMMCTKMVPEEEDQVEKFIGDQKLKGYAVKNAKNKRRFDNNQKDNHVQQPLYKRQNISGQGVARAYTAGSNEKKGYAGPLPYCNKCKLHHEGPCTVKFGKCNKVGHMTRDCMNDGHYRNECPKLKNQTRGNKAGKRPMKLEGRHMCWEEEKLTLILTSSRADRRGAETNTVLRGCTLGLLGHPFNIDLMHCRTW